MKAREVKRAKLVAKYAAKRAALKEAGDYAALDKLPKNASRQAPQEREPGPPPQPLLPYRSSERIHARLRSEPYPVP